jgi:predicted short-subunit dehydrogenase-like oxidoreductase (DUF2520 family)
VPKIESVFVLGAGKVGAGLARAMRREGVDVTLRPMRKGLPKRPIDADLVILAIRDRELLPVTEAMVKGKLLVAKRRPIPVVHCAGALGPEVLSTLQREGIPVAQMHPMISFASPDHTPSLLRGQLHVDGDPAAVKAARSLGRLLGMTPRTIPGLDRVAYHAAAGLVANGAAALAAGGIELLHRAGVDRETAAQMLGPLIRSVGDNVELLGMPAALTGPVRRGDAAGVAKAIDTLRRLAPELVPFYLVASRLQIPLARSLGEAAGEGFDAIESTLAQSPIDCAK